MAGCATPQQTASLECGAGGAAIAYLACKAMGNSNAKCIAPAAVVAGVGAAVCYSYASRLEKRRHELAGREDDLDARIKYVRGLNEDGQRLNAELRERVKVVSQHTAELLAQVGRNQVSAEQLASERQRLDGEVKAASEQVALQRGALGEVKTYQSRRKTPAPDLDTEIEKQDRLLGDAQRQVETLASLRERV
jgi:chromosome segregation ATPase